MKPLAVSTFDPDACRLVGELAALVELLHHVGRLGAQTAGDLVVAPARLDLVLDLVEGAVARRGDAEHVVPDIAAAIGNRLVVDADVAVEGLRDDVEAGRDIGRLAVGQAAGAVDGIDGDGGEPQLLRGLDHAGAAAALVFHLVAQVGHLGARTLDRDLLLQIGRDAFIVRLDRRLDHADLDQRDTEAALHRLAHVAGRQRKSGIRNRWIEDAGFARPGRDRRRRR